MSRWIIGVPVKFRKLFGSEVPIRTPRIWTRFSLAGVGGLWSKLVSPNTRERNRNHKKRQCYTDAPDGVLSLKLWKKDVFILLSLNVFLSRTVNGRLFHMVGQSKAELNSGIWLTCVLLTSRKQTTTSGIVMAATARVTKATKMPRLFLCLCVAWTSYLIDSHHINYYCLVLKISAATN